MSVSEKSDGAKLQSGRVGSAMAPPKAVTRERQAGSAEGLPSQLTRFIGRAAELAEVRELLRHARLVTLTGSAGSGKTRLALQLAVETRADHPDGSWFVALASVTDPSRVIAATAQALGISEEIDRSLADTVADYLRARHGLLVLDNCEHLIEVCADLVLSLLGSCPHLHVLATSREFLRVAGERAWPVPPLSLPALPGETEAQGPGSSDAVLLFADRGALARRSFQVTDANAAVVACVCRRLDGMPLAIELAAARLRVLTVEEIEARLETRFRLLTSGEHRAIPRHQSLHAAIDWSFELLSPHERRMFGRLAIFAGGFTLQTAEAICAADVIGAEDVLDLVTSLVEKSLVVPEEAAGEARFRLLETMREYGRERLEDSGELAGLLHEHAAYFLDAAIASEGKLTGADQAASLRWLHQEQADMCAALDWWRQNDPDRALWMAAALGMFWYMQGLLTEGREQLIASLNQAGASSPHRAAALYALGLVEHRHADYEVARAHFDEAEALFRARGDARGVGRSVMRGARALFELGDTDTARQRSADALGILGAAGDDWALAQTLTDLGIMHGVRSKRDPERSIAYLSEALAMRRGLGDRHATAFTLCALSQEPLPFETRKSMLLEAIEIFRKLDDGAGCAVCLEVCAALAAESDQPRRAVVQLAAARAYRALIRGAVPLSLRLGIEQEVAAAADRLSRAEVANCEARGRTMSLGDILVMVSRDWADVPEGPQVAAAGFPPLTPREAEVARLVAAGLSNRQIADRLFISPRTAEYHVEQIRNKLGFHSRTQVAAWSADGGARNERSGIPRPPTKTGSPSR